MYFLETERLALREYKFRKNQHYKESIKPEEVNYYQ